MKPPMNTDFLGAHASREIFGLRRGCTVFMGGFAFGCGYAVP